MKPALLLIDMQKDFLDMPVEPSAGYVVDNATKLLHRCRALSIPVIHVWTTANSDQRMPHWKQLGKLLCVEGTDGHSSPRQLRPLSAEAVIHKTFFSAFSNNELSTLLQSLEVDTLLVAGVHLHGCIRSTVLDAYQKGYTSLVAEDAIASDDPLHSAVTQRYLESRAATFLSVAELSDRLEKQIEPEEGLNQECIAKTDREILHFSPRQHEQLLWRIPVSTDEQIDASVRQTKESLKAWRLTSTEDRLLILERIADSIEKHSTQLTQQIALEIGKPVRYAREEVARSIKLLKALSAYKTDLMEMNCGERGVSRRYRPLGTVVLITPWNNPLAIPLGKIGPALFYGNAVVWKPAPNASSIAHTIMEILDSAQVPPGMVNIVCGDRSTALKLMKHPDVDGVSLSGSLSAGYAAQDICAARHIPLQAELGGNNAAIVWSDGDLQEAASKIAESAFGFAGQRCTANRRVVVESSCYRQFLELLEHSTRALRWDDPMNETTDVGPLITQAKRKNLEALVKRAESQAQYICSPHQADARLTSAGAYFPPTFLCCEDPSSEIVQEESFGPILIVQKALSWNQSMELCNGVKQGLVASLFSQSEELQSRFLQEAQSGILKVNAGTANAGAEAPFGGWKASGTGPPEHGSANREFYTRTQSVYR